MKKIIVLLFFLILTLAGCSVKGSTIPERVTDTLECLAKPEYLISAEIPAQMLLAASEHEGLHQVYTHESGEYEILTDVFTAASLDDALIELTGYDEAVLNPIPLDHFPLDEYRYAWTSAGETGTLACCGTLLYDGTHYYSLTIRCEADKEKLYHDEFTHILSTVGLQSNEGV